MRCWGFVVSYDYSRFGTPIAPRSLGDGATSSGEPKSMRTALPSVTLLLSIASKAGSEIRLVPESSFTRELTFVPFTTSSFILWFD